MPNEYSDKEGVQILIRLLANKGICEAVLSPGSRNAPLLVSVAKEPRIRHYVILDERSAAFFALGLAQQSGKPVILACTSGTAILNYAPAIAEAWYQRIPLIVISADRPIQWVDQDDSQAIRQNGILRNIVKASWSLLSEIHDEEERWYANRIVNEALNTAQKGRKGPVHLNIPLGEPLYETRNYPDRELRNITFIDTAQQLAPSAISLLAQQFRAARKVMVLAGFYQPDEEIRHSLHRLSREANVVILTENISNLDDANYITTIDRVLSSIPAPETFAPDLLISFGGPLISRQVKTFLRNHPPQTHWTLDNSEFPADTFKCLTSQINLEANDFFKQLDSALSETKATQGTESGYAEQWKQQDRIATKHHNRFIQEAAWSDLKAFSIIMPQLPQGCALQVSNGTPVRYAQLFKHPQVAQRNANRGTSGIEGATSVAVGASASTSRTTILITGDMSFLYDSNALWNPYLSPRLKIVVMKNGGGGIFRFIPGPSGLEELEECFETAKEVNVEGFANTHKLHYFKVANEQQLKDTLTDFFNTADRAAVLEVETPRFENARILKDYFKSLNNNK